MTKTWQLFSDGRNNFLWQSSSSSSSSTSTSTSTSTQKALIEKPSSPSHHHLPSVSDVLLQGYSKLYTTENWSDNRATESRKPVVVKQSSLAKASTFLGDQYTGYSKMEDSSKVVWTTLGFHTGSGKPVAIKQSSLSKAHSMFGGHDVDAFIDTGCFKVHEDSSNKAKTFSNFQNGSRNLVAAKEGSFRLDDEALSSSDRAGGSFGRDHGTSSMFQTGSGKAVNICSTGLIKARTLLGLEENIVDYGDASKGPGQSSKRANSGETFTCHKPPTGLGKPVVIKQSSLAKASTFLGDQDTGYLKLEDNCKVVGVTGIFRTGSGKPVAFKQSSLSRAQSMFGGQDNDTFADTGCLKVCDDSNNKAETSLTYQTGARNLVDDALPISDWAGGSCGRDNGASSMFPTGSGKSENICSTGYSKLEGNSKVVGTTGIFRTGSGKPVAIKQSSLSKAQSMLGGQDDDAFVDTGCLKVRENCNNKAETSFSNQNGSKNLVDDPLPFSDWAGGSFGRDDGTTSMFQTGSGKAVNIGSTCLIKARTLLGLEENLDNASKGPEQSGKHANAGETFTCQEATPVPNSLLKFQSGEYGGEMMKITNGSVHCASRPPPIKFQTAGGRSVKVSADALKRARSLLGDPDLGDFLKEGDAPALSNNNMFNKNNNAHPSFSDGISKATHISNNFISPLRSALPDKKNAVRLGKNLIKEFDAAEHDTDMPCSSAAFTENTPHALEGVRRATFNNGRTVGVSPLRKSLYAPLVDISNTVCLNNIRVTGDKRKLPNQKYPTPFKKPRNSKFISPLNTKYTVAPNGTVPKLPERKCSKGSVSTRYPFQYHRKYIREYLGEPPYFQNMIKNSPEWLRKINPANADKHMFEDEFGLKSIGLDSFFYILGQSGCSTLSKEWTANHYRWIVWKLACYDRCYPTKFSCKLLTADNVLEELKYRYEREVNNGHKSALKRILEGDAPPSSPLVLCIASIQLKRVAESDIEVLSTSNAADNATVTSIELTDGWYSVKGLFDELLIRQVVVKKLFVGQKIRIWGARLCGWNAPVSPLEASREISLCLHINGTYRAHWADRLGFCKSGCPPLAFKCIKASGGVVPSTLVGVTRAYPVLYRERLSNGSFVVRSERMESKATQLYEQRRSSIVESVISEFQWGLKSFQVDNGQDTGDEGEKLFQQLEQAAEPELIMADMSKEQLLSFAAYQAKVEATRQSEMHKSIEMALEEAGLSRRKVDTFMRVRVVGLTSRSNTQRNCSLQGLVTIWNPTEKQQSELVEGQAYVVGGLTPNACESHTIYLHDRGSTSRWQPLSLSTLRQYQPFFNPRKSVSLLKLGEVPLFGEFDVAAFVIYVGEVHKSTHQKTQWIFVADGSRSLSHDLLAISFRSPSVDCDSVIPINHNLVGSTVGFCNLIKGAKDERNNIWVAEAIDNSTYFLSYDGANSRHFKNAAACADRWAKASTVMIEKLKRKVLSVVAS